LIRGAQSLFGVKTLQFVKQQSQVFSQNKNLKQRALSQGGGTLQDFEMFALDYDNDRHFFLITIF
jgi:cell surface protein SprA